MTGRRVTGVGGVELALRCWDGGSERPVLLVHGLASNARMWDQVAEHLSAAGHPVVAIDQRGHGRSEKPPSGYDFATVAGDLASVVIELGWCRPVVAGQSWGGNVVVELAARHPGTVGGVVCVDGGWIDLSRRFPVWEDCAAALAPPVLDGVPESDLRARVRASHPDWGEAAIEGYMANFDVRDDGTVRPWLGRDRHMQILRALWEHRPFALYGDIDVPVLLVPARGAGGPGGMGDDVVAAAAAALRSGRLAGIEGHHDLHAHRPAELAALMTAWMDEAVRA